MRNVVGKKWPERFTSWKLGTHETVVFEVPEPLDEETIAAVREKIRRNKSVDRNPIKNRYLLNGLTFCGNCGYSVSGVTNTNKKTVSVITSTPIKGN